MLSKMSVRKPFTVLVAVVIVIVFGVVSYTRMTPDLFPSINTPYVMRHDDISRGESGGRRKPRSRILLKNRWQHCRTSKDLTSVSAANYSVLRLEFPDDVNIDAISVDIRDKIDQVEGQLPEIVQKHRWS